MIPEPVEVTGGYVLEGLAIPFGGRDVQRQSFGPETDLIPDWFPAEGRPALYQHGLDPDIKTAIVGRQVERELRDKGHWIRVQLDRHSEWLKAIMELVDRGVLFFSTGAVPHLVRTAGERITTWPWVEVSLTTTPASPVTGAYRVPEGKAIEHLAAVKADIPSSLLDHANEEAVRAELVELRTSWQVRQARDTFLERYPEGI